MKIIRIAILALLALPLQALAQTADEHICRDADLAGSFILVNMTETPKGQEVTWYQDYQFQYLVFHSDHTYDFVAARHQIAKAEDLQKSINMTVSYGSTPILRKYTLDGTGLLSLYLNDRVDYTYRCLVLDRPRSNTPVGGLELKGYSKQNTLLDKFFRRWP